MNTPKGATPFNLELALTGDPVVTREGFPVTDFHHFKTALVSFPVYAVLRDAVYRFTMEGRSKEGMTSNEEDLDDLFMAPKPVECFVNVHDTMIGASNSTLKYAIDSAGPAPRSVCKLTAFNGEIFFAETVHLYDSEK